MIIKNYLTKIQKSFLLRIADVNSRETGNLSGLNISNAVMRCDRPLVVSHKGALSMSPNNQNNQNYVKLSTTNQKASSEKLGKSELKSRLKKIYNRSLSEFFTFVKSKFADTFFKPKTRDFTLQDLKLVQKLFDKNKLDYPKAWAEFYKITGTNKNTFNN